MLMYAIAREDENSFLDVQLVPRWDRWNNELGPWNLIKPKGYAEELIAERPGSRLLTYEVKEVED